MSGVKLPKKVPKNDDGWLLVFRQLEATVNKLSRENQTLTERVESLEARVSALE